VLEAEYHHSQPDPDLRCGEPGAIEMAHGVLHINKQVFELRRAKPANRLRNSQEAWVAHFQNFAYCHGS
jgi:hypothetical protein